MARSVDTPRRHAHLSVQRAPLINPCPVPSLASVPRKLHEPSAGTPVAPLNHFNEAAAFQLRNPARIVVRQSVVPCFNEAAAFQLRNHCHQVEKRKRIGWLQ